MADEFLSLSGLSHLWDKLPSIFAKKSDVSECQKTLIVTCAVDFASGKLTNVSHTHSQIQTAYNEGKHIVLNADISQMLPNGKATFPLVMVDDEGACFSVVVYMGDTVNFLVGIKSDGSSYVLTTSLVSQAQLDTRLGGLTFDASDTIPATDDKTIITFVDEG